MWTQMEANKLDTGMTIYHFPLITLFMTFLSVWNIAVPSQIQIILAYK